MHQILILASVLILLCVLSAKALYRFGVPSLLIFLALGMIMGSDGIGGINFDSFEIAGYFSTPALVIIIFFGGFETKWGAAKTVAAKSLLLSSFGTVITALVAGLFCMLILKVPFIYGLLFGSVIASTDAASVFSILHSRRLKLKNGISTILEVESGSNDPFAYMMTMLVISVIMFQGSGSVLPEILGTIAMQIVLALAFGAAGAALAALLLKRLNLKMDGLYPIMLIALVVLFYSLCSMLGGNGLLCVYIIGVAAGNTKIRHRVSLAHFFDGLTWLMQIVLFFMLGLLSFPSKLPSLIIPGMLLSVAIMVIARPAAVFGILSIFRMPVKQQIMTSWVGLRGAASIVFAIVAVETLGDSLPYDLFHLVFFVALFSIMVQGTLTPFMVKKLDLAYKEEVSQTIRHSSR